MVKFQRGLFLLINSLFIAKYTIQWGYYQYVFIALYCSVVIITWGIISKKINDYPENVLKISYLLIASLTVIGILSLHSFINPLNLRVDRWSAIHNFIQFLFQGKYPYSAHTHLGGYGSPFPVWQVFHIPFFILGDVGLGMLFTFILTTIALKWLLNSYNKALNFIILLIISPAFWYEVAVRSDLMYNLILCFLAIAYVYKKQFQIQTSATGLGILFGLFLSTRFSIIIPFTIFFMVDFMRSDLKHKIIFVVSVLLTFIITFLPFILWDFNTFFFFRFNPFILQTRQGSLIEVALISFLGIYLSFKWKNNFKLCSSYISITLFSLVLATFLHLMISDHFKNGLFDSKYDITYFSMAIPFIIFSLNPGILKQITKQSRDYNDK